MGCASAKNYTQVAASWKEPLWINAATEGLGNVVSVAALRHNKGRVKAREETAKFVTNCGACGTPGGQHS